MKKEWIIATSLMMVLGCENREINEGEEFRPRAVKDNFEETHFTKVVVDGVEYIMTERDNNNPHEGFGFMAIRGNRLFEKQDTILSYLRTMQYFQNKIYSRLYNLSEDSGQVAFDQKFLELLGKEQEELIELKKEELINRSSTAPAEDTN